MARLRVLVVDDDGCTRDGLRAYLEREGYEVRTAADPVTALRWIKRIALDFLVIDMDLSHDPDLAVNGLDVIVLLRIHQPLAKAILMSASVDPALLRLARERGAVAHLEKPFDPARLSALLRSPIPHQAAPPSSPIFCPSYEVSAP